MISPSCLVLSKCLNAIEDDLLPYDLRRMEAKPSAFLFSARIETAALGRPRVSRAVFPPSVASPIPAH
jgi:hypothetical protein